MVVKFSIIPLKNGWKSHDMWLEKPYQMMLLTKQRTTLSSQVCSHFYPVYWNLLLPFLILAQTCTHVIVYALIFGS